MNRVEMLVVEVTLRMADGTVEKARSATAVPADGDPVLWAQAAADSAAKVALQRAERAERRCPNHPDRPAASQASNLCGPCLMGRAS